jgi:spore maturation protein CgeB
MYQTLADSKVTLNIHADSSPTHASNMRLFETTGVGTCLLTDWKSNLATLFEPDREVIVYSSSAECVEKARWLLANPGPRQAVAMAGQQRTLRDHTFARRAHLFDGIIRSALKARHET